MCYIIGLLGECPWALTRDLAGFHLLPIGNSWDSAGFHEHLRDPTWDAVRTRVILMGMIVRSTAVIQVEPRVEASVSH